MVVARLSLAYLLAACGGLPPSRAPHAGDQGEVTHSTFHADDDEPRPSYSRGELERTLSAERTAIAAVDASELDPAALADLHVRERFAASLEVCRDTGHRCPPRLDDPKWSYDVEADADPKLDAPLRFDLDDWRKIADELHGRACACRTLACVDSLFVAIGALEKRPMPDVEADEIASASITRARECLFRLRGEKR
ncbi:MAG: hypothetical protein ACM31C_28615 [Acidobacteriota bacterium]